ncbi:MAG: ABC transporter permease subunit [Rhizobiales bacterium]|nr:ABC transporter permease subunit [Hyphomicrobiales bacterium]MBI3674122.1 ABC transporter permease subunit [Hyphomicrobiales bacterium]
MLSWGDQGYGDEIALGTLVTLQVSFLAYLLGFAIGLVGAVGKLAGGAITRGAFNVYTTLVRAVPELVLILLLYYAGSDSLNRLLGGVGLGPVRINALVAGIVVLGFVQGAYQTEVIRAAIQAIPIGQIEAARAYGMGPLLRFRRVVLPAMLPFAIPGLANLWLNATKDSALISVVGLSELALTTKQAAGYIKYTQGNPLYLLVFYALTAAIYLAISLASNQFFAWLERRTRRGQRQPA